MPKLLTHFVTIATAGATLDGREIKEEWLQQVAKNYDPDLYTAVINFEHIRNFGNFGTVQAVRLGRSKSGKTTLEAQLAPNPRMIELNKSGQKLFTSAEIKIKFADTGEAYLFGLALTDSPASLGTTLIELSAQETNHCYSEPLELNLDAPADIEAEAGMKALLSTLTQLFRKEAHSPEPAQDEHMNDKQLKQLLDAQSQHFATLNTTIADALAKATMPSTETTEPPAPEGDDTSGETYASQASVEQLTTQVEQLSAQLTQALEGKVTTPVPPQTGSESEPAFV